MPYRIDWRHPPDDALDRLLAVGALDVEPVDDGLAAIVPDRAVSDIASVLGADVRVTPARGRDDGSVWVVAARPIRVGRLQIVPSDRPPQPGTLRMVDGPAFGTGLHPTTALCLEAVDQELDAGAPAGVLDVGTGSGVLALAALLAGVPHAVAVDIDIDAMRVAEANARLNGLAPRLRLVCGGPEALSGAWPLVLANVLAAPLIEMAPTLARRVGRRGRLVLSGIRASLADEVMQSYRRVGMRPVGADTRDGWSVLTLQASW